MYVVVLRDVNVSILDGLVHVSDFSVPIASMLPLEILNFKGAETEVLSGSLAVGSN